MSAQQAGFYRFPSVYKDSIVFVSEDDLWTVHLSGGIARRLTSGVAIALRPFYSPDGTWIAFSGRDEGNPEVTLIPAEGGAPRRLTYIGGESAVLGWTRDGRVLYRTVAGEALRSHSFIYAVSLDGAVEKLPLGTATAVSYGEKGVAIGRREGRGPWMWKRYRGGTAGDLWVDTRGSGDFVPFMRELKSNLTNPLWIGNRLYFLSDHEGVGNLYSATPDAKDLRKHTQHKDYYIRYASSDGSRIVYDCGGDLYVYDPAAHTDRKVAVEYHGPRTQAQRKFVPAVKNLESGALHPEGHSLALSTRGKIFSCGNWEGAVLQHGEADGVRQREAQYLHDGKRLLALSDKNGDEELVIFDAEALEAPQHLSGLDIGRVAGLLASPVADEALVANHRSEIVLVDLKARTTKILDRSTRGPVRGLAWSPDGRFVAYAVINGISSGQIKIWCRDDGSVREVTKSVTFDQNPVFDAEGKYLSFVSSRVFNPVYDGMHFDLGFPKGMRPYLITLKKDTLSPFAAQPHAFDAKKDEAKKDDAGKGADAKKAPPRVEIDFDGIQDRVIAYPLPEAIYHKIEMMPGKALFQTTEPEGSLDSNWLPGEPPAKAKLGVYDFETQKTETLVGGMSDFSLSSDRKTLLLRVGNRLRVLKAGEKPDDSKESEGPGRKSGWIDLERVKVSVEPRLEWKQMYREAWRLQRDNFWVPDMSKVDWKKVYERYLPLLERVSCRSEFADLIWEMQGELGTSHAYEFGGDYRPTPRYEVGLLGAKIERAGSAYRIGRIYRGDSWNEKEASPLAAPGLNVREGDTILAVNGRACTAVLPPQALLVSQACQEVRLTLGDAQGKNPRSVQVKTLKAEEPLRYREWVEKNRAFVHEKTKGRIGYVHIPNMGPNGFAEFHRYFLAECERDGLIVDVRCNGGGHVSQLLLEKLARKRIGYDLTRWYGHEAYPSYSIGGPMVALTDEFAGSDGDIFSHSWKMLKLGPLVGKRTWGGVIGIAPRHFLMDGAVTTQPEYSFWFEDVGFGVENYGTDPDIDVDYRPQDWIAGRDPQMERGLEEVIKLLETKPPKRPDFSRKPDLSLPV